MRAKNGQKPIERAAFTQPDGGEWTFGTGCEMKPEQAVVFGIRRVHS